jgi:hypothetical protein
MTSFSVFSTGKMRRKCWEVLHQRFAKYGLQLHPDKTRLIEFGPQALTKSERGGKKPATFDFLGFTHTCAWSRRGYFTIHLRTMRKRLRRSLKAVAAWCREHRHDPVEEQWEALNRKLRGHYQYYGRPTNYRSLQAYYRMVRRIWKTWLNRRTRGKSLTWERYGQLLQRYPHCCSLASRAPGLLSPSRRVAFEEPSAAIPQARVCEGGGRPRHGDPKLGTKPETAATDKVTLPRGAPSSTRRFNTVQLRTSWEYHREHSPP